MLSKEELLRDRYKVIADFPGCSYEVGTVLYVDPDGELYSPIAGYSRSVTKVMQCDIEKYSANIQPLPWWSDREPEDMPEYLEWPDTGVVCKPSKYLGNFFYLSDDDSFGYSLAHVNIATLAEYEAYQQSKNNSAPS